MLQFKDLLTTRSLHSCLGVSELFSEAGRRFHTLQADREGHPSHRLPRQSTSIPQGCSVLSQASSEAAPSSNSHRQLVSGPALGCSGYCKGPHRLLFLLYKVNFVLVTISQFLLFG
ncbi:unnamed protein product [Rangifer tarandus platyrhynchus]|uniref:Uncharacterized protein n=2 Tax=Rangifer tarandus platyrhynchus TaxID=3082113 RepID=A0AC59ZZ06_RANTA|nr:unnamed protein product [Rangifer tarandus platyrhynchus]